MDKVKKDISKKTILISIFAILLIVIASTYAYLTWVKRIGRMVLTVGDLSTAEVRVSPYIIEGSITPSTSYINEEYSSVRVVNNKRGTANVKLSYDIDAIDSALVSPYLKYMITKSSSEDGEYEEYVSGNFSTVLVGDRLEILNEEISGNSTSYYKVYLWIDGSLGDRSDMIGKELKIQLFAEILSTSSECNAPVMDDGLIPVVISNDGTVTTVLESDSSWYDYDNKVWANAVLVNDDVRSTYKGTSNEVISSDDILAYFVWIPRYKYKIWFKIEDYYDAETGDILDYENPEQTIDIVWEEGISKTTGSNVGEYLTHPAFTFGNDELEGIWVGKFETTTIPEENEFGDVIDLITTILPNKTPLTLMNVSSQFQTALQFSGGVLSNGNVTFSGNSIYGLSSSVDSHMMKNSEWGAVAYLSHSVYGINGEVRINNYYDTDYLTGCGASEADADESSTCDIPYGNASSYPQSTTGNISGVFDMSGGTFEYVMGNYGNYSGNSASFNSGFNGMLSDGSTYSGGVDFPSSMYYDLYSITQFDDDYGTYENCTLATCGGHALSETAWWYNDVTQIVSSNQPWFVRGGYNSDNIYAGVFGFANYGGGGFSDAGFRVVLAK